MTLNYYKISILSFFNKIFYKVIAADRITKITLLIVVLSAALQISCTMLPWETQAVWFIPDDSFYYFKIAQNIAVHHFSSFDGEHVTNGYHPLWMAINTVVAYFAHTPRVIIHTVLFIGVILNVFASIFVALFSRRFFGLTWWNPLFLGLAILNPTYIISGLNGLETALVSCLFLLFVWLGFRSIEKGWTDRARVVWGVIGGFVVLSRVDYGIFVAIMFLWYILEYSRTRFKDGLLLACSSFLIVLPWFLWSWHATHSLVQESGLAFTLVNKTLFYYKQRAWYIPLIWSLHQTWYTIRLIIQQTGVGVLIYCVAAISLINFLRKPYATFNFLKEKNNQASFRYFVALVVGAIFFVFIHGGVRWSARPWYFGAAQILLTLIFVYMLSRARLFRGKQIAIMGAVATLLLIASARQQLPQNPAQKNIISTAFWVKDNLPRDARIASFNSGIIGFLSEHYVYNSDGLVNHDAYTSLKSHTLWQAFERNHIQYALDYDIAFDYRYAPFFGVQNVRSMMHEVRTFDDSVNSYHGSRLRLYKIF